ncbi:zinc dependent phospholipase C-domain-containing protein [Lipomyces arxii]|uniref:zinc dependent phospholipase C-domain-containing protein n=1 Tax=Lipomyces arxii TaxID=56418 RepID=UPI0034CF75A0
MKFSFLRTCALMIELNVLLVSACGIGVHVHILSRIREHLPPAEQSQSSFSIPGAFFPDAFYGCMSQSDSAELAHWPPFLHAAAKYYHDTYKTVNNPDGVGLRTFLYGVLTHQIADISWHSLGVDQGLLAAMAIRDFDGDYSAAHSTLDMGGDMIMVERLLRTSRDLSWVMQQWSIPSQDIINIYGLLSVDINRAALEYCMARGVAALGAEINIAHTMYPGYAKKSPVLVDGLEDYFLGGLSEITSSIVRCLGNFTSWLEDGPGNDAWSLCQVFAGRRPSTKHYHEAENVFVSVTDRLDPYIQKILPTLETSVSQDGKVTEIKSAEVDVSQYERKRSEQAILAPGSEMPIFISTGVAGSQFGSSFAFGNFRGESIGLCVAISAPYEFEDGAVYVIPLSTIQEMFDASGVTRLDLLALERYRLPLPPPKDIKTAQAAINFTLPRRFGTSMAPVQYFNVTMLAVSSPGTSTIDIFASGSHLMTLEPPSEDTTTAYGLRGRKLFGTNLRADDLDGDGFPDLIVSAPNSDASSSACEQGEVLVLSGRGIAFALLEGATSLKMDVVRLARLLRPAVSINSLALNQDYELFGATITFSDHDGSEARRLAYIGAPGTGAVYAFDAASGAPLFWMFPSLSGPASTTGFGSGVLLTGFISGLGEWVLVGSPNESFDSQNYKYGRGRHRRAVDQSQHGVCYLYLVRERGKNKLLSAKLLAYIIADSDDDEFGKFGYAGTKIQGSTFKNTVFISSPFAERGNGAVWRLEIENALYTFMARAQDVDEDDEEFDTMAATVLRLHPMAQGSQTETEAWFGKASAAVATNRISSNGQHGYLFVGLPHMGFGDIGDRDKPGSQLQGGVTVYSVYS